MTVGTIKSILKNLSASDNTLLYYICVIINKSLNGDYYNQEQFNKDLLIAKTVNYKTDTILENSAVELLQLMKSQLVYESNRIKEYQYKETDLIPKPRPIPTFVELNEPIVTKPKKLDSRLNFDPNDIGTNLNEVKAGDFITRKVGGRIARSKDR